MQDNISRRRGLLALSPLLVFVCIYLLSSIVAQDFYAIPVASAFLIASVYAMLISRGETLEKRIEAFSRGAGNKSVLLMIWIFIMAGAFASSAKAIGAIDATVNLAMAILPGKFIFAGLFLAACFISMSIGTSVGTIVALVPIASGIASQLQTGGVTGFTCEPAFITAIIVGGAFFGDNLSFISDTTIAATQSQGCKMKEKFYANLSIVLPAAIAALVIYLLGNQVDSYALAAQGGDIIKALPYLLVIILALCGVNVLVVLVLGIVVAALLGLVSANIDLLTIYTSAGEGLDSMCELILVTILAGGIMGVVKQLGGFGKDGRKGFDTVLTRLQMQGYVTTADFEYRRDKHGAPYGWGIARYAVPEQHFGTDFTAHVYTHTPEESRQRILAHLAALFPQATETQLQKLLG